MGPVVQPVHALAAAAMVLVVAASTSARAQEPVPMTPDAPAASEPPAAGREWGPVPRAAQTRRNGVFTAGLLVTIVGGLQIPVGVGLFAVGQPGECEVFEDKPSVPRAPFIGGCGTSTGAESLGIGMIITGATGVLTGAFMMALGKSRVDPGSEELAWVPTFTPAPRGGALRWTF